MENTLSFEKIICEMVSNPGLITIWSRPRYRMTTLFMQLVGKMVKASGKTGCVFAMGFSKELFYDRGKSIGFDCSNIVVDDSCPIVPISADTIRKAVTKFNGNCIIAIDYYQLLDDCLAADLKLLALELAVPIFIKGTLSRISEDNPEGRPALHDLKGGKSLLYGKEPFTVKDSDMIMFLWRPHKCHRGLGEAVAYDLGNKTEIIVAKNRWGELGTIHTEWNEEKACFENVNEDDRWNIMANAHFNASLYDTDLGTGAVIAALENANKAKNQNKT